MRAFVRAFGMWWVDRRLRRDLDGLEVSGLERLTGAIARGPVLVACTHQAWWDGPIAVWLCRRLGVRVTLPMRDDRLAWYPFFRAFGAVGATGPRGIRAILNGLRAPGDVVWIFPQGRHQDPSEPLELERGATWLADRSGSTLIPAALGYAFHDRPAPRARLAFGEPVAPALPALAAALADGRRSLREPGFEVLIPPRAEGPDLASRALAALWRWTWTR